MRKFLLSAMVSAAMVMSFLPARAQSLIEVTGSATINIVPDRITVEIGMEEYFMPDDENPGDSIRMSIKAIERDVRRVLRAADVNDSMITVADMGNYRDRHSSSEFLMGKRLSVIVTNFEQLERIANRLHGKGITSFSITKIDNSDMTEYNRQGLKSALDAARAKAEFIAANEGVGIVAPVEIIENGLGYEGSVMLSNVAYDGGSGMDNMRRIVRRYSVKVKYQFKTGKKK